MNTLPTCPREDCRASDRHYHRLGGGTACQCRTNLDYCQRDHAEDEPGASRCYAPRTPQPQPPAVVLPTVDEVADAILASSTTGEGWHVSGARGALDLIASRITPWHPVEPGTIIKAGTRYRVEWDPEDDDYDPTTAAERIVYREFSVDPTDSGRYYIDPRTVPAEPEDPRVGVIAEWMNTVASDNPKADYRDLLARLDAVRADA